MSKLYIGNLNVSIKENDLVELFGLNTTKYLRETCSLNMPMNDKTGQSKGYAFVSSSQNLPLVPGKRNYCEAAQPHYNR